VLKGGAALSLVLALPACGRSSPTTDAPLATHRGDGVVVDPAYDWDVILRWGDPLFDGAPALDARAVLSGGLLHADPADAARQFGYNCDAVQFFSLEGAGDRGIVCVNHEYTNEELFLPGLTPIGKLAAVDVKSYIGGHPGVVALAQAMHGHLHRSLGHVQPLSQGQVRDRLAP